MKSFIVVGNPRSGTTVIAKHLAQLPNVTMPALPHFELFNTWSNLPTSCLVNHPIFDQSGVVAELISQQQSNTKYFGFKTLAYNCPELSKIIQDNQLDVIVVLRKNIWKVLGSALITLDHHEYSKSGKTFEPYQLILSNREITRIRSLFHKILATYWLLENFNIEIVDKIYFEDLLLDPVRPKINAYFDQEVRFDLHYDDSDDISKYFAKFQQIKKLLLKDRDQYPNYFSVLPDYIKQHFDQ
jgi:hypothetical protein